MRICVPIKIQPEGGLYTFLEYFQRYLLSIHWSVTSNLADTYDVLFVNSWVVPDHIVAHAKISHPRIVVVQRVDGSSQDYGNYSSGDTAQSRVNLYADLTIYQSKYSNEATRQKFKVLQMDGPIIYNPVDLDLFFPNPAAPSERVACVSYSMNPKKGSEKIEGLARANPDLTFVLCGRFANKPALLGLRNVELKGHLGRADLASTLRGCGLFLSLTENDSCPNVVIEALATGLPIIYVSSGGVPELVEEAGIALGGMDFREAYNAICAERAEYSMRARGRAERLFSFDNVFPRYIEAIQAARRRPIPHLIDRIRLRVAGYPVLSRRDVLSFARIRRYFSKGRA